jgi:hypothetical protein
MKNTFLLRDRQLFPDDPTQPVFGQNVLVRTFLDGFIAYPEQLLPDSSSRRARGALLFAFPDAVALTDVEALVALRASACKAPTFYSRLKLYAYLHDSLTIFTSVIVM